MSGVRGAIRRITWPQLGIVLAALGLVTFMGALMLANNNSDDKTANIEGALSMLERKLDQSEATRSMLVSDRERWQAQITTSIDQLKDAGQQPIIVAPDAIPAGLSAAPVTPTTLAPPTVILAPPSTTEAPVPTEPPPPPETTTEAPLPPTTESTTTTQPETTTTETTEEPAP